ncbi:MAG TPA: hypothetical protein VKG78_04320, partial [Opitutaceae bacterium]|nr:hypothetical protein [Opitutaceae bacterium]
MRYSGILLLVLGAAVARAGDPPAPAGDSIATAKKEFAAIKASSSPLDASSSLPGIDGKDAASLPPEIGRPAADLPKKKDGTGNWLVDAMEQKPEHSQAPRGADDLIRGELSLLKAADSSPGQGERSPQKALGGSVFNPLDAFMRSWVSAHDRELLLAPANDGNLLPGAQAGMSADALPHIELGPPGSTVGDLPRARDAGPGDLRMSLNPYAASLDMVPLAPLRTLSAPDFPGMAPLVLPELSRG